MVSEQTLMNQRWDAHFPALGAFSAARAGVQSAGNARFTHSLGGAVQSATSGLCIAHALAVLVQACEACLSEAGIVAAWGCGDFTR